jgi:hypothetical protein
MYGRRYFVSARPPPPPPPPPPRLRRPRFQGLVEAAGRKEVAMRLASMVFPEPGGPTRSMLATVCDVQVEVVGPLDAIAAERTHIHAAPSGRRE